MYGYSYDKSFFEGECVSRSQANREAKAENPNAKIIYIGKWKEYIPDTYHFDDVFGEFYEATTEQEEELQAMQQRTFARWARKNGFKPRYIDGSTIVEYRVEG